MSILSKKNGYLWLQLTLVVFLFLTFSLSSIHKAWNGVSVSREARPWIFLIGTVDAEGRAEVAAVYEYSDILQVEKFSSESKEDLIRETGFPIIFPGDKPQYYIPASGGSVREENIATGSLRGNATSKASITVLNSKDERNTQVMELVWYNDDSIYRFEYLVDSLKLYPSSYGERTKRVGFGSILSGSFAAIVGLFITILLKVGMKIVRARKL